MAVLKNKTKRENYLVVSKIFLQDKNLSLTERGLLATLHSFPDDWDFSIKGMAKILPDGEDKIRRAVDGLINKGYLVKKQDKASNGRFGKNIIELYERPLLGNPVPGKPISSDAVSPKPSAENPMPDNHVQYNSNEYSNQECNNNQSINHNTRDDDGETDFKSYREIIANNIDLEMLQFAASQRSETESKMVDEIYNVICDMVCYPRKEVIIKGVKYPWECVKSHFLKLDYEKVADVLNRIIDADLEIKNMSQYLISTLYDACLVGVMASQAAIHDDYLRELRGNVY